MSVLSRAERSSTLLRRRRAPRRASPGRRVALARAASPRTVDRRGAGRRRRLSRGPHALDFTRVRRAAGTRCGGRAAGEGAVQRSRPLPDEGRRGAPRHRPRWRAVERGAERRSSSPPARHRDAPREESRRASSRRAAAGVRGREKTWRTASGCPPTRPRLVAASAAALDMSPRRRRRRAAARPAASPPRGGSIRRDEPIDDHQRAAVLNSVVSATVRRRSPAAPGLSKLGAARPSPPPPPPATPSRQNNTSRLQHALDSRGRRHDPRAAPASDASARAARRSSPALVHHARSGASSGAQRAPAERRRSENIRAPSRGAGAVARHP